MTKIRAVLVRRWWILVIATAFGLAAGVVSASLASGDATTLYDAQQVVVANRQAGNPAFVLQDALKIKRGDVSAAAAEQLGRPDEVAELTERIAVEADDESGSIIVTATSENPDEAVATVEAFVGAFLQVVNADLSSEQERQLGVLEERANQATAELEAFDAVNGQISRPDAVLEQTPQVDALVAERRRLVESANAAKKEFDDANLSFSQRTPYSTLGAEAPELADSQLLEVPASPLVRGGLLAALGLLLGVGLIAVLERAGQRIDTREELAELVRVPIIAEIGRLANKRRPYHSDGRIRLEGLWAEHYRRVRSAIQFVQSNQARATPPNGSAAPANGATPSPNGAAHREQVFLVTSALPSEGKSTTVALTARALAEAGADTLVVSADFRKPSVDKLIGFDPTQPGLEDRAQLAIDRPKPLAVIQPTDSPKLWLAASGRPTNEVGHRLEAAREVISAATERGATVLVDSAPLKVANDAIDLLPVVDEVILVVRAGRTTREVLEETLGLLEMHGAPLLGVVLIGTLGSRKMYAYYASYYGSAPAPAADPSSAAQPAPVGSSG